MKVTKITAYKSNDGGLWETESDAINQNINDSIADTIDHTCEGSNSNIVNDIKKWIKDYPKEVRYVLANIKHAEIDE